MTSAHPPVTDHRLGPAETAVLRVLLDRVGKVTGRHDLNRLAGLDGSERRCDAALVALRRLLGPDAVKTIRRRGWMLSEQSVDAARILLDSRM